MAEQGGQPSVPSIDPAVRLKEARALQRDVLSHAFTQASLDRWMAAAADRLKLFEEMFWGTIRWPRTLGRSAGAALADGFTLSLQYQSLSAVAVGGGAVEVETAWHDLPAPTKWDADDDADHYRVNYAGFYRRTTLNVTGNKLSVAIAGRWINPLGLIGHGYRLPDPLGFGFGSLDGRPIVLPEITVVYHILQPISPWMVKL